MTYHERSARMPSYLSCDHATRMSSGVVAPCGRVTRIDAAESEGWVEVSVSRSSEPEHFCSEHGQGKKLALAYIVKGKKLALAYIGGIE